MYQPRPHRVDNAARQHAFIRENPLGLLITHGPGGLMANPIPFLLDADRGVLRAHVARANPQWRDAPCEALAVFQDQGAYVTPSWYPAKQETHEVVPTWNYVCAQARGALRVVEDRAWLRRLLDDLTAAHEAGRPAPWAPSDAPADYIERRMDAIVGLELAIASIEGKWKVSQNQPAANRAGVSAGLRAQGGASEARMAARVEDAMPPGDGRDAV